MFDQIINNCTYFIAQSDTFDGFRGERNGTLIDLRLQNFIAKFIKEGNFGEPFKFSLKNWCELNPRELLYLMIEVSLGKQLNDTASIKRPQEDILICLASLEVLQSMVSFFKQLRILNELCL